MKKIVVATHNQGKVGEIEAMLRNFAAEVTSLAAYENIPEAVEDGQTFQENAILKARHYALYTSEVCLADDSGLEVDVLKGAPGVYSARYAGVEATDEENNQKLLAELKGVPEKKRTARFRCVLAVVDGDKVLYTANGTIEGVILEGPKGQGGFGYDPLFFVPSLGKTLAEVTMAEKNSISHRGQALRALSDMLAEESK
ncbi:MAG: XTP/dITP diphosphatase [Pelosinus sp.]|nr:XTP/dITP diphosphatase [Pelosinus sp.]